jgi:hemoglobin
MAHIFDARCLEGKRGFGRLAHMSTIYDAIGGEPAVAATVEDLYTRVLRDPDLSGYFAQTDMPRQKSHLRRFVAAALGGPQRYAGRDMHAAHARLGVTATAFDKVVAHLAAALSGLGVPERTIEEIAAKLAPLRAQIVTA